MRLQINLNGNVIPVYSKDRAIFQHCAGGMAAVTVEYFDATMRNVLAAHLDEKEPIIVSGYPLTKKGKK